MTSSDMDEYYAVRADEYEQVYANPERQGDLERLRHHLSGLFANRSVLEIACGTGYWTQVIALTARTVHAVDRSDDVLAIARRKALSADKVGFARADAMKLPQDLGKFDAAFAGFWWSHIPVLQQGAFLSTLHAHLHRGARVALLDNLYVEGSSTPIARRSADGDGYQIRSVRDGRRFEVLKNFPSEAELRNSLRGVATGPQYLEFGHYWLLTYEAS